MSIIDSLNEEQKAPVLCTDGPILVTAGAGSGKTRLLTHRIAYLICEKGVLPQNILAITFTNKAANEMKTRIMRMVPNAKDMWISTFHSMCVTILRQNISRIDGYNARFSIYTDTEKNKVLKDIYNHIGITDDNTKKNIEYHISNIKNSNSTLEEYLKKLPDYIDFDLLREVYIEYNKTLKNNNALDFDDLLVMTYYVLYNFDDVREYYQNKFKYIHIDEFQDTNTVQYDIASILAGKWHNILVVGDEDQCIYGWRGANIENITNFKRDFPTVKIFKLEQNYRSTKKILNKANLVIANNEQRLDKTLWTQNEEGADVSCYIADNDRAEADYVTRTVHNLVQNFGYNYRDIAILMRYNAPSRLFEEYLLQYNIPYKVLGGFKFFERAEIKNIIAYLRAIVNPKDNESILRIINYPKRGIGDSVIAELQSKMGFESLVDIIKNNEKYGFSPSVAKKLCLFRDIYNDLEDNANNLNLEDFVEYLVDKIDFKAQFNPKDDDDYNKIQNIDQFVASVKDFVQNNPDSTLPDYLESITLISDIDSVAEDDNNLLISTVHAVKGLEYKVVFIVALENGMFPIIRTGDRPSDIEEERRLMYVAITRAKERLYLTMSRRRYLYNQIKYQDMSPFLEEMGYNNDFNYACTGAGYNYVARGNADVYTTQPQTPKTSMQDVFNNKIQSQKKDVSAYVSGVKVMHPKFGVGIIIDDTHLNDNRTITINFDIVGNKTLSLDYAPLQILKK
ncbi:MAG: UvrD-helicase domain-containing protein [Clostridia bacterium]|nr:UvrD-helicase domain-containing protein [Clostridia bacterium]